MASLHDIASTISTLRALATRSWTAHLCAAQRPTLMFANRGVSFKNCSPASKSRITYVAPTAQKMGGGGGKHNDLDTRLHRAPPTVFERGEFSFAIIPRTSPAFVGSFDNDFGLPGQALVTVYHTDDEAADIWKRLPSARQPYHPHASRPFWRMGPTALRPLPEIFMTTARTSGAVPPQCREMATVQRIGTVSSDRTVRRRAVSAGDAVDHTGMGLDRSARSASKHDKYPPT